MGIGKLLHRVGLATVVSTLVCLAHLAAEEKPPALQRTKKADSDLLVLRRTVRRVVVDIVVRDSTGKAVRGLTARDFSVSEDSRPQRILSFDAHDFDSPSISLPTNAPPLPPNVFVNVPAAPERGPLYVILFDMVNTDDTADQIYARKQSLDFIRSKPAGARFAIYVHSDGLHLVQGFTDDKDLLVATIDPQAPKSHFPRAFLMFRNFGHGDPVAMISVMTHIAQFLDGIPGRKNLIWMSGAFPMEFYPRQGDPLDLREDMRQMVNELTRAQVAVYPVNVRGVVVNPEGALTGGGSPKSGVGGEAVGGGVSTAGAAGSAGASGGTMPSTVPTGATRTPDIQNGIGPLQYSSGGGSLIGDYATQDDLATATGGRAFYSDNDLKAALDEAVDDGGNYYELSYSPTNSNYDGSLRKIHVAIEGRGYHLAYRRSYYADNPQVPRQRLKKNQSEEDVQEQLAVNEQERPIYANLQHGASLVHQLIFKARIHPVGTPALATPEQMARLATQSAFNHGKHKNDKSLKPVPIQNYAIYYVLVASQIKPLQGQPLPLEFAAVAYDSEGWIVNGVFEKASDESSTNPFAGLQAAPPESWEPTNQKVYRAMQQIDVPVSATSIRIAVRDTSTNRVGALEIPLPLAPEPDIRTIGPASAPVSPSTGTSESVKSD
jgi:VWFA-related protein